MLVGETKTEKVERGKRTAGKYNPKGIKVRISARGSEEYGTHDPSDSSTST